MAAARDASAAGMQRLLQATLDLRDEQRRLEAMKTTSSPHLQCVRAARAAAALAHQTTTPLSPPLRAGTSSRSTLT